MHAVWKGCNPIHKLAAKVNYYAWQNKMSIYQFLSVQNACYLPFKEPSYNRVSVPHFQQKAQLF